MPRAARIKDPMAIYHIMSRSITEFDLFPSDEDKEIFLDYLKNYKEKYHCKIYAYCLMSNHYHIIADTCGYDISKFMKCLNQKYVKYINKKYNRKGHLLDERFNSKIIQSDEYLMTVSSYVHNNAKDIPGYSGKESEYPYSSMGIYTRKKKDKRELVDTEFILGCINEADRKKAQEKYAEMVVERRDTGKNRKLKEYLEEFQKEQYEYKSYREELLRNKKPEEVVKAIADKLGISNENEIMRKWKRSTMDFRRITAYVLNTFCGMGINEVARYMRNITASCCAGLSNRGYEITKGNKEIRSLIMELCKS